jgi:hypothetical protein
MNVWDFMLILSAFPLAAGLYASWIVWRDERLEERQRVPRFRPRPGTMKCARSQRPSHSPD